MKKALMGGRISYSVAINNIFCPPCCVLCPGGRHFFAPFGRDSAPDKNIYTPPLKLKSTPDERNPGHASVTFKTFLGQKYFTVKSTFML